MGRFEPGDRVHVLHNRATLDHTLSRSDALKKRRDEPILVWLKGTFLRYQLGSVQVRLDNDYMYTVFPPDRVRPLPVLERMAEL